MFKFILIFLIFISFFNAISAVDINTATKKELMTLDGIGPKKADSIIEYRTKNKFTHIEDIKNVKGIDNKTFVKIKDKITVDNSSNTSKSR